MPVHHKLRIFLLEGELTHDTDFLTKMDPFIEMHYCANTWKSIVLKNAGKKPIWHTHPD